MKFFKNKLNKKVFIVIFSAVGLLFVGSTHFTHAQSMFGIPTATDFISTIAFFISYVLAIIFGTLIAIEAWFIGIILNINANILQTPLVQTGFSISLSIANLAFVLGIIVIALATILRNQTYGIKQLLWKLVVMAILVNFGLVIMSPIFAIGNSFTQYFLNCINPGSGGCTQNASSITSFNNFGTTLAAAFNPANPLTAPSTVTGSNASALQNSALAGSFNVSSAGTTAGQLAVPIFGIVFVAIDLILIVIVLGVFISMLTIRYLYVAILAILLPFAWASWVFPSFSSHWKKWWEQFIRWTFFAPVVLFFVYLALLTMKTVGSTGVFDVSQYTNTNNGSVWGAISSFLTGAIAPIMSSLVQEILLGGLIIGGMMAANSMGIKMAGAVVETAKKGGNAAKGWAQKQTKKGGVWAYQKTDKAVKRVTNTGLTERLQTGNIPLQSIPGIRRGASLVARGIQGSTVASNAKMVEDAQKKAPKSWETAKKNLQGSMNTEDQFAHIAVGVKEGKIKVDDLVDGKPVSEFLDNQDLIARYGQQKLVSDFDKITVSTPNSRRAKIAMDKGQTLVDVIKEVKDAKGVVMYNAGTKANPENLKNAADAEFIRNSTPADLGKGQSQFGREASKDKKEYDNRLDILVDNNPAAISTIMKKLDKIFDKETYYNGLIPKLDIRLKDFDKAREDLKSTQTKIKELEKIDKEKRNRSQEDELAKLKAIEQASNEQVSKLSTKINLDLDQTRASLNKTFKSRFEADTHEEHEDHGSEHKKDDDKSHGGSHGGGGGHAPAATPPPAPPKPKPSSGGGGNTGGHSSGGGHGH